MYTGGVSSLAEQIANQLQRKEQPKTLLDKKELVRRCTEDDVFVIRCSVDPKYCECPVISTADGIYSSFVKDFTSLSSSLLTLVLVFLAKCLNLISVSKDCV